MEYTITIAGYERHLPLCPISEDLFIAAFIMFNDVELTVACAEQLLAQAPEFDVLVTAEAKGIPLAYEMARQSGRPYIIARKQDKLYMHDVIRVEVDSITTDHPQTLCIGDAEHAALQERRVLIVDDVISTGESLAAIEKLVLAAGGQIVGRMTVLAEGAAAKRQDIRYLEPLPLFHADGTAIAEATHA